MLSHVSHDAAPGDLVHVYNKEGQSFGSGFYNPRAKVPLRVLSHGTTPLTESTLDEWLLRAIRLRKDRAQIHQHTNAFRLFNSDGDGISGLIVEQFNDVLIIQVTTLGVWLRTSRWLKLLTQELQTKSHIITVDPDIAHIEQIRLSDVPEATQPTPPRVQITENQIRYEIDFQTSHKTGFFCDQRDNRKQLGQLAFGSVLDICCYTGGFAINAAMNPNVTDVTAVDLDEKAIATAKRNANLNQKRISWIHADSFTWMRQMIKNAAQWDTVILDPPKLIHSRDQHEEGLFKYRDMNTLAIQLVKPGGLFVTCSCSGLLSAEEFELSVIGSAHRQQRKLQIIDRSGAGIDHPQLSNCPESRYLKVIWAQVF
jgi:23S rRNA (cytosine1962-C5)-methyltransferase